MRKYLLIDMYAHKEVIAKPKIKTDTITTNNEAGVMISISCGSYFTNIYAIPIKTASAITPDKTPIHMLRSKNGRRMNPQLAPTNFIVLIR